MHFPYGTTLIGHTLNPVNGILSIVFLKLFTLLQTYNLILLFAFVSAGFAAFLLAFSFTKNYFASLVAGYIYTFSQFHFAHGQGHLQTVTIQFIPLFILSWWKFLRKPSIIWALGSAFFLYLNLLADYYFFFYCVLFALLFYLWKLFQSKDLFLAHGKKLIWYLLVFLAVSFVTSGKIIISLFIYNLRDPLIGAHPAAMFSADLFSIFIPGGHWRFADLTSGFWTKLAGNFHESSVYLGVSVVSMVVYILAIKGPAFKKKGRAFKIREISLWYLSFFFFLILSFGPYLQVNSGRTANFAMPYILLEKLFPFLAISGIPVRMMVMVYLSAAVIIAYGIKSLVLRTVKSKFLFFLFLVILFIDYLPLTIPVTKLPVPGYIQKLKRENTGGLIDLVSTPSEALYYQTIHQKPIAAGYIARIPQSVLINDLILSKIIKAKDFDVLCREYGFKYLLTQEMTDKPQLKIIASENNNFLYELNCP